MRITGGKLSGRVFEAPMGQTTRPTTDRVRESVFNILAHRDWGDEIGDPFVGKDVLDPFCGTGALAFEALSYGAKSAHLFDKSHEALGVAEKNAKTLGLTAQCNFRLHDAAKLETAPKAFGLVFLDPPYKQNLIPPLLTLLHKNGWLQKHTLIVAETNKKEEVLWPAEFELRLSRSYGDTSVHFLVTVPA